MNILKTSYAGLELSSPIIAASSPLSSTIGGIINLEQSGVGAIVLKSLFEEQIHREVAHLEGYKDYPETTDYLNSYLGSHRLDNYLQLIHQAKQECDIPIIASINCISGGDWDEFARKVEQVGADALELNIFINNTDKQTSPEIIERSYLDVVWRVCAQVEIPVVVKLARQFTNLTYMINNIEHCGAKGVVLFNRLSRADIDIWNLETKEADLWSNSSELVGSLRPIAMASAAVPRIDIAASGGVHSGGDTIKAILAGASAVQVCSAIYQHGLGHVEQINCDVYNWLTETGVGSIEDIVGMLNYDNIKNPHDYERVQFIKYFAQEQDLHEYAPMELFDS
ncbi:MAG: dihydroorotate dehydrogenase-like protein [Rikenellaceae bacterium]